MVGERRRYLIKRVRHRVNDIDCARGIGKISVRVTHIVRNRVRADSVLVDIGGINNYRKREVAIVIVRGRKTGIHVVVMYFKGYGITFRQGDDRWSGVNDRKCAGHEAKVVITA